MTKSKKAKSSTEKKYTFKAIISTYKGIKRDVLKNILNPEERYSIEQVENLYNKFLEGGRN